MWAHVGVGVLNQVVGGISSDFPSSWGKIQGAQGVQHGMRKDLPMCGYAS